MTQVKLNYAIFKVTVRDLRDAFERDGSDWGKLTQTKKNRLVGIAVDVVYQWADTGTFDEFLTTPAELRDVLDYAISQWRQEGAP